MFRRATESLLSLFALGPAFVSLACTPEPSGTTTLTTFGETGGDGDGDAGDGDGDGEPGDGDGDGDPDAVCGDGVIAGAEQCDDGNTTDTDACTNACLIAACGDGIVYSGVEECDDGNPEDTDDCTNACEAPVCGDGIVHEGVEPCDDGNDDETDGCNSQCMPGVCGDGILHAGEACDDGNVDNTDFCADCQPASCGDGYVHAGIEPCDDGNDLTTDDCIACTPAACGDGHVQEGVETCDDANDDNSDDCVSCQAAACGDGFAWVGVEACDGEDFAGQDCDDFDWSGGNLLCDMSCNIDLSQCTDDPCGGEGFFYADRCWIIADNCDATVSCANAGHVGTNGNQNGVNWDANVMAAVAAGLGLDNLGDNGCCAISAWINANNQLYSHNFGNPFYNYTCLGNDFPLHVCTPN
jgi:cysteine-rich repeat protein